MKTAVVYYSLDGNCAFVAEEIKTLLNASGGVVDLIRLQTKDEKKRSGFGKFLWGGGMVFMHKKPPLKPYTFDPQAYDRVIIGVPVWAGSPAPIIQTFLSETSIKGKKFALFVCHGGGMGKALNKLKTALAGNEIIADANFINPAKTSREMAHNQIADWVKTLPNA